jgi:hypothetical protein
MWCVEDTSVWLDSSKAVKTLGGTTDANMPFTNSSDTRVTVEV